MLPIVVASHLRLLSLAGSVTTSCAVECARLSASITQVTPQFQPGVSILKPVKGLDPEMYVSFASHFCGSIRGPTEILFGRQQY